MYWYLCYNNKSFSISLQQSYPTPEFKQNPVFTKVVYNESLNVVCSISDYLGPNVTLEFTPDTETDILGTQICKIYV